MDKDAAVVMESEPSTPVKVGIVRRKASNSSLCARRSTVDGSSQGVVRAAVESAAAEETHVSTLLRRSPSRPLGQPIRRHSTLPEAPFLRPLSPSAVGLHSSKRTATAQLSASERFAAWQRRQLEEAPGSGASTPTGRVRRTMSTPTSPGKTYSSLIKEVAAKHGIPPSKVVLYKEAFDRFDTNHTEMIEYQEFCKILDCVNSVSSLNHMAPVSYDDLWHKADRDSNGQICFEEFVLFYQQYFYKSQRGVSIFAGGQGNGDYERLTGGCVYDALPVTG